MATWVMHMMVVDKLFNIGIELDEIGFSVGNIAPDCNVENEDWTVYTPPREVTHWMNGSSKLSADYEGFYDKYFGRKLNLDYDELSFLFGYYAHLIVDVEFQRFVRDKDHVLAIYDRLNGYPDLFSKVEGLPHNFDTIKNVFGRQNIFGDITSQEVKYLRDNPGSMYNTVLKNVKSYPDYIDYLPEGAIVRKLKEITSYLGDTDEMITYFLRKKKSIVLSKTRVY